MFIIKQLKMPIFNKYNNQKRFIRIKKDGFTIVEILVALSILSVVAIGIMSMQTTFGRSTTNRVLVNALNDVAADQMSRCQKGLALDANPIYYRPNYDPLPSGTPYPAVNTEGQIKIYVYETQNFCSPSPPPSPATYCRDVIISATTFNNSTNLTGAALTTAINNSKKVTIQNNVCNFN